MRMTNWTFLSHLTTKASNVKLQGGNENLGCIQFEVTRDRLRESLKAWRFSLKIDQNWLNKHFIYEQDDQDPEIYHCLLIVDQEQYAIQHGHKNPTIE